MANGDTTTADDPEVQDTELTDAQRAALAARTVATMDQVAASAVAPPLINSSRQQYAGTPTPNPTGQGRIYMGPLSGEGAFMQSPVGTRIAPPPPAPLAPEAQAALQSRLAAGTQEEPDAAVLERMQAQDRPGSRTIGVSRPQMPTWQDRYTVNGQTDVAGLAREAQLRQKAQGAMLMNDWYDKVQKIGIVAAGPPPDTRSASGWKSPTSQTTSRNVGGVLYTLNPQNGKWEAQTPVKPPAVGKLSPIDSNELASVRARKSKVQSELDRLTAKYSTMTTDEQNRHKELGGELMDLIDSETKLKAKAQPAATATATTPPNVAAPAAPKKPTARDKAVRANALAIAHPEWTDAQIKDAVRKEMAR